MSDTTVTTDPPLPNSDEARTPTGELKDQQKPSTTPTDTPKKEETKTETSSSEPAKDGDTLLTEKDKAPAGAPEKYEDFKLPDGVKLEEASLKSAHELFKTQGLSQTQAQALVDFHVAQLKSASDASTTAMNDMRADWQAKTKADPDIGPKLSAVKETVGRALDTIGDAKLVADFRQAMDLTGVGDHPAFIKTFYRLAQSVVEGKHVAGAQPSKFGQQAPGTSERPTTARALYPNNP